MSRKKIKVILGLVLALAAALVWPVAAHYRAKLRVEDYKRQLRAAGEKVALAQLIPILPAGVPNGALPLQVASGLMDSGALSNLPPTMKWVAPGRAVVAWKEDPLPTSESSNIWPVLSRAVRREQEIVADIRAALGCPVLCFELNYQQGFNMSFAHLSGLKGAARWLTATMLVELHENHSTNAWENLRALTALVQRYRDEPMLLSELVRIAVGQIALNATWEALQSADWRDEQLAELQAAWQSVDLLTQAESVLAMERVCGEQAFAKSRESYAAVANALGSGSGGSGLSELAEMGKELVDDPKAGLRSLAHRYPGYWAWKLWGSYEDELVHMQALQAGIQAARTAREEHALGPALKQLEQDEARLHEAHPSAGRWLGDSAFVIAEQSRSFLSRIRTMEMQRALLVTALALKRYQLKHGAYPTELAALAPAFLSAVPRDPIDAKPLRYQLKLDGSFLLYSVGQDGQDNGGDATQTEEPVRQQWWRGRDAVWPQPASREEVEAYFAKLALERKKAQSTQTAGGLNSAAEAAFRKRYGLPPLPAPSAATNDPGISQPGSGQTSAGANSPK